MDDINFEELDKAVNSALQQAEPKPAPTPEVPDASVQKTDVQEASDRQPIAPRRRGQFMDMVHPSSDMIKQSTASRPSRQAPTLQPLNPSIVETTPQDVTHEETPISGPSFSSQDDKLPPESEKQAPAEWPDPLDVMEQTEHERHDAVEPTDGDEDMASDSDVSEEDQFVSEFQEKPATSPFINGADLEKRPLGAFADAAQGSEAIDTSEVTVKTSDSEEQQTADFAPEETRQELAAETPTPQELTPEVVSVESDDPTQMENDSVDEEMAVDADSASHDPAGITTSIPQQYRNPDLSTEEEGGHPVFDTNEYHQPLTPPVKKGHTVAVTILVIITLALLGAGAWYAIAVLKLI